MLEKNRSSKSLALELGISLLSWRKARTLFKTLLEHPLWNNQRSPHSLMIDCLYLVVRKEGYPLTINNFKQATVNLFGISTQPRPSDWSKTYQFIIDEVLD
tara:strand:+ start:594 stop:896 length:303 start_codon:yes stop_codon:yes gene_type:complete